MHLLMFTIQRVFVLLATLCIERVSLRNGNTTVIINIGK